MTVPPEPLPEPPAGPTPPPPGVDPAPGGGARAGRRGRVVALVVAVAVVVAGVVVAYVLATRPPSEEARIQELVTQFARAVDRENLSDIVALLCEEEAEGILEDDDYDPDAGGTEEGGADSRPVEASDVRVTGDVASAVVSRPGQPDTTLWFRIEEGRWTVCAPAGDEPEPTPGTR
ncbi:hypothetical protein [Cellulomonas shaoxiangyii]|uniref:DUF4878 domain-containing protein n=1 Tax=Cellulomonas shaoxiangyii TaxID=2566013 RepID=A0A4P7SKP6_9CELL|nr:hypothetical protein [Cellulomonas shaoxiangyii]QCB94770.1 hypothetical protein E5225_15610 [Cellulomonas shaoxiangyii]TGY86500.1 hypothetical protein E5226_01635 [Cellulomonas shaoxiangyii]